MAEAASPWTPGGEQPIATGCDPVELEAAERDLVRGAAGGAAERALGLLRGQGASSTGALFVLIQAYNQMARLGDLEDELQPIYGGLARVPADGVMLWAALLVASADAAGARALLERYLLGVAPGAARSGGGGKEAGDHLHPLDRAQYDAVGRVYVLEALLGGGGGGEGRREASRWLRGPGGAGMSSRARAELEERVRELGGETEEITATDGVEATSQAGAAAAAPPAAAPAAAPAAEAADPVPGGGGVATWAEGARSAVGGLAARSGLTAEGVAAVCGVGCVLAYAAVAERRALCRAARRWRGQVGELLGMAFNPRVTGAATR